jgi:DNA-binding response OmpR family regulator
MSGAGIPVALVVDARAQTAELLKLCLGRVGFHVVTSTGVSALEDYSRLCPDLVVVDLQPPAYEALRLCKGLRTAGDAPIMVLGSQSATSVKLAAFEAGADDHLGLPFQDTELAARARALVRRAGWRPRPADPLTVGEIEILLSEREVRNGGSRLRLRPKEFNLLAFLARKPGLTLTRNQLLDAVWGLDYPGGPRTVDSHVLELRHKLSRAGVRNPVIETVWGVGYKLRVMSSGSGPTPVPVRSYPREDPPSAA